MRCSFFVSKTLTNYFRFPVLVFLIVLGADECPRRDSSSTPKKRKEGKK